MGYIGRSPAVNEFAACIGHGQFCSRKLLAGRDILLGDIGLVLIRCVIHGNSAAFDNTLHHFKGNALCLIISTRGCDLCQCVCAIRQLPDMLRCCFGCPALHGIAVCIGQDQFCSRKLIPGGDILLADIKAFFGRGIIHDNSAAIHFSVRHGKGDALCHLISVRCGRFGQGIGSVSKACHNMRCIGGGPLFYQITGCIPDLKFCSRQFLKGRQILLADHCLPVVRCRGIFPAPCLHPQVVEGYKSLFIRVVRLLCMEVGQPCKEVGIEHGVQLLTDGI